jgi:hypothetical protein
MEEDVFHLFGAARSNRGWLPINNLDKTTLKFAIVE